MCDSRLITPTHPKLKLKLGGEGGKKPSQSVVGGLDVFGTTQYYIPGGEGGGGGGGRQEGKDFFPVC